MATGTTADSNLTRDGLIQQSFKLIGVYEDGDTLTADQQADGIIALNLITRSLSDEQIYLHGKATSSLTLVANTWVYTSSNGLPTTLSRLLKATYRDESANDWPVEILSREQYESLTNKLSIGNPTGVFLTDELTISGRTLYVYPTLASVNTQSVVTGSDANPYKCIRSHTSDTTLNKPITGSNYLQYWESGGSGPSSWANATEYEAPQLLRLTYERPLYDFDLLSDNPDIPQSQTLFLKFRLAQHLAPSYGVGITDRQWLKNEADEAYFKTFKKSMQKSQTARRKGVYF